MAKFTIVLTSYNHEIYIRRAIESIRNQTFEDWEMIIIDDCSTDNSMKIIQEYAEKDRRIIPWEHHENFGVNVTVANGIAKVRTELFGQLDSDDALRGDAIELAYKQHTENPDVGFMYSGQVLCDEKLEPIKEGGNRPLNEGETFLDSPMGQWRTYKLSYFARTEGVDLNIPYAEDLDMIYKMEELGKVKMIEQPLYYIRELPNSICRHPRTANLGRFSRAVAKLKAVARRCGYPSTTQWPWKVGDHPISIAVNKMIADKKTPLHREDFVMLSGLILNAVRKGTINVKERERFNPLSLATVINLKQFYDMLDVVMPGEDRHEEPKWKRSKRGPRNELSYSDLGYTKQAQTGRDMKWQSCPANPINVEPKFSLIMANYNKSEYIADAIESVRNQISQEWELIIIDDRSTDNSINIIKQHLCDGRIKLIQLHRNKGYTAALKIGIASICTDIFGIIDSDDCLVNNAVGTMYEKHIKNPDHGLIYSQFVACNPDMTPRRLGFCGEIPKGKTNLDVDLVSHFKTFKLCDYLKSGGYDEEILYAEDKDISYRMEEVTQLLFVDEALYLYRELSDSQCRDGNNEQIALQSWCVSKINAGNRRSK